jgi:flagellar FliL protein
MATEAPAAKPKGKKMLIIIIALVLVLLIGGGLGAFLLMKRSHASEEDGGEHAAPAKVVPKGPPTFLPFENMVVNLADPGGNRFVQVGLTLQVDDQATSDQIKAFMPSLRSAVLVILSQRTADELLQVQGKEQLSADIIGEVSRQLGYDKARHNPVQAVLFSSFIIQ